jgi:MFS family permease
VLPFILLIVTIVLAYRSTPDPVSLEALAGSTGPAVRTKPLSRLMVPYGTFTVLTMAGFCVFPLMAYHFTAGSIVPEAQVPVFYAIAMAADALFALIIGRLYDKYGISVLVVVPCANIPVVLLAFSGGYVSALGACLLWGVSMGAQETVLRAALADLTSITKRGTAYGIFNTLYGSAWFAGSLVLGWLYEMNLSVLIWYAVLMQLAALVAFLWLRRLAGRLMPVRS